MALIECTECGKQISDRAESCPACGFPLKPRYVKSDIPGHGIPTLFSFFVPGLGQLIKGDIFGAIAPWILFYLAFVNVKSDLKTLGVAILIIWIAQLIATYRVRKTWEWSWTDNLSGTNLGIIAGGILIVAIVLGIIIGQLGEVRQRGTDSMAGTAGLEAKPISAQQFRINRELESLPDELCTETSMIPGMKHSACYMRYWKPWLKELVMQLTGDEYNALNEATGTQGPAKYFVEFPNQRRYVVFTGCRPHSCDDSYAFFLVDHIKREMEIIWVQQGRQMRFLGPSASILRKTNAFGWLDDPSRFSDS